MTLWIEMPSNLDAAATLPNNDLLLLEAQVEEVHLDEGMATNEGMCDVSRST